jgi:hypothetical protein
LLDGVFSSQTVVVARILQPPADFKTLGRIEMTAGSDVILFRHLGSLSFDFDNIIRPVAKC